MTKYFVMFILMFISSSLFASDSAMYLYITRGYFPSEDPVKHISFKGITYPIYDSTTYKIDSYFTESDSMGLIYLNIIFPENVCIEQDMRYPINALLGFNDNIFLELNIPSGTYDQLSILLYKNEYEIFKSVEYGAIESEQVSYTRVSRLVFLLTSIINMYAENIVVSEKTVEFYATYFWAFLILIYIACGGLIASTFFIIQKRFSQIGFILSLTLPGVLFFLLILGIICFVTPYVVCIEKSII